MKRLFGLGAGAVVATILSVCMLSARSQPPVVATGAPPAAMDAQGPGDSEHYAWKPVAIGGGGFITGLSMDDAGQSFVARSDVHGAWIWDQAANRWTLLTTAARMADRLMQNGVNEGVYEIAVAPSDGRRIYMAVKGAVYRTDDRGLHWTRPAQSPFPENLDPNARTRLFGPFLSVDPQNPDMLLFGPPDGALWLSRDGAQTWQKADVPAPVAVPEFPAPRPPGILSWFRRGKAGEIWIMIAGRGMYRSVDGGHSFASTGDGAKPGPLMIQHADFARDGSLYGVDPAARTVWKYADGRWADLKDSFGLTQKKWTAIAINPEDDTIFIFDEGGRTMRSGNGGERWWPVYRSSRAGDDDVPWHRLSNQGYFATGAVMFDPKVKGRLWVGAGFGVFRAQVPSAIGPLTWESQSRGIEELVGTDIVQTPGHAPMFAGWDFGIHVKADLNAFSTTYGPRERVVIAAQQVATSPADPLFAATNASDTRQSCCSEDGQSVLAGFTQDGGKSWARFPTLPTPPGTREDDPWRMAFGTIAVAANDTANIIWEPTNNRSPFYTRDRGATWHRVVFPGEVLPFTGAHGLYMMTRKTLAADRVRPNTFYLVHSGNKQNPQLAGLWRTTDGGATWLRVHEGEVAPFSAGSAKLRAVPGKAGHLFFTSGLSGANDTRLRRSSDGGGTWQVLDGVTDVDDLGFGKAASGASYPAIYLSGRVGGDYGIWRSVDDAHSWQRLVDFPAGRLDQVTSIAADPDHFGRVYIAYMGSGFMYGEPAPCTPSTDGARLCTSPGAAIAP